ncbi:MAG: HAMP domain-containing sensor histidine kinase [Pirellulales bacterium]
MLARAWRNLTGSTGRDLALWPVLSLLALVVVAAAAGFLWLLEAATRNARLAARQYVADAYKGQLPLAADRLNARWAAELERIDEALAPQTPAAAFAAVSAQKVADAVIVLADGQPIYPQTSGTPEATSPDPRGWSAAVALEFRQQDFAGAAAAYAEIAREADAAGNGARAARARQAQARSFAQAGQTDAALQALASLADRAGDGLLDDHGRLIAADAKLRRVQLLASQQPAQAKQEAAQLAELVNDYRAPLPASQRRFLMDQLASQYPALEFPSRVAESLASAWLAAQPRPESAGLAWLADLTVWQARTPSGRAVLLFRSETLATRLERLLNVDQGQPTSAVRFAVAPPGANLPTDILAARDLGAAWPGWRTGAVLRDSDLFDSTARRDLRWYAWAVALLIAVVTALVGLAALAIRRQLQVARLKNDLAATVSHELRTPLASMRVLVDTLLDAPAMEEQRTREYLQLISTENLRLSRLIENFLVFSRLSRGKQTFDFRRLEPQAVVDAALAAVRERFDQPGCTLTAQVDRELPAVRGDFDALVTVLVNLLDNAYKYTGESKQVALRCWTEAGQMCFAVRDNGQGMTRRVARRAFDRFYQGDQRLARGVGGCGLGLSIVQAFVAAHGGQVSVDSEPDHGSTFTVRLPAAAQSAAPTLHASAP